MTRILTTETRKKIGDANRGKIFTLERRMNISKALKGRIITPEWRENISKSHKGQKAWNKGLLGYGKGEKNGMWKGGSATWKERKKAYELKYKTQDPERYKERRRQYHQRHKNEANYILATTIRKRILKLLGKKNNRNSSVDYLGCSIDQLKFYLEGKFKEKMDWSNHGLFGWHIDHIRPLSSFDLSNEQERKQAFHYSNLQPLWAQDNLIKADKI